MLEARIYHKEIDYPYTARLDTDEYGANFDTIHDSTLSCNYLTFDGRGINLIDENLKFYEKNEYTGYTLPYISNKNCEITEDDTVASLFINTVNVQDFYPERLTLQFKDDCCKEIEIVYYGKLGFRENVETVNVSGKFVILNFLRNYYKINVHFTKTTYPNQHIRLESAVFGTINTFNKFTHHNLIEEINVLSDDLPINQFEASIVNDEPEDVVFAKKDPLVLFSNGKYYGHFYISDIKRTAKNLYSITAQNLIGILSNEEYIDWVSTNKSLLDFVRQLNTKIVIDGDTKYNIFGYIPVETKRFALCAACFGCGLMVDSSRKDNIILKKIPFEVSSTILTKDRRIIGDAVFERSDPILYASVTYPNDVDYSETGSVTLAANGDGWQFHYFNDAPVVITKRPSSNVLYNTADNYVEFQTENESVTFEYAKYKYLTNTESTNNPLVTEGSTKEYKNFQIRGGIVDSEGWVSRISRISDIQKFIQSRGKVKAKLRLRNEKVGDLIQIETAWDGIITGIITKMDITFGYEDIANIEVLEWNL